MKWVEGPQKIVSKSTDLYFNYYATLNAKN
jgi:hypothetical protein